MKKNYKNIVLAILPILGLCVSSCTSEDEIAVQRKTYTLTVDALKTEAGSITRGLILDGSTLSTTWATTDKIYVSKSGTSLGTLTPQSEGTSAILRGELTGDIAVNDDISFMFPRSSMDYREQDGTLSTIASKYDYAVTSAKVTAVEGSVVSTDAITFASQQAIVKFVFTNKFTGEPIDAEYVHIIENNYPDASLLEYIDATYGERYGSVTLNLTEATWTANGGTGIVYVALNCNNTFNLGIDITDANDKQYEFEKEDVTFERGKYYIINVPMMPKAESKDISKGNITVPSGCHYSVSGRNYSWGSSSSDNYYITLRDGAFLTLNGVDIKTDDWQCPIYCEGNAYIMIADGTTNTLQTTESGAGISINSFGSYSDKDAPTLTIFGNTGTLNVSTKNAVGIGAYSYSNKDDKHCNIVINGGLINVAGGSSSGSGAAAIGTSHNSHCGNITINGGTITAIGGRLGAGIGTGSGTCGDITINGGTIIAKGFSHCAGIGSGYCGTCGNITIGSNVTSVTASCGDTGLSEDAGISAPDYPVDCDLIGNGYIGSGAEPYTFCGTVTIDGVANATTSSTFTNFNSAVSKSARDNDTWTLTHK